MSLLDWNDRLLVGVSGIDSQHRELTRLVNALSDAMAAGEGQDVLGRLFDDLVGYTVEHFGYEEGLMSAHAYPDASRHRQEHDGLKAQILGLRDKTDATQVTVHTLAFLSNWLVLHITGTDKVFAKYLNAQGLH